MLKSDLYDIMLTCAQGKLQNKMPEFHVDQSAVAVVLASGGYPGSYRKGIAINGLDEAKVFVYDMFLHHILLTGSPVGRTHAGRRTTS